MWQRGIVQYPVTSEPVTVPSAPAFSDIIPSLFVGMGKKRFPQQIYESDVLFVPAPPPAAPDSGYVDNIDFVFKRRRLSLTELNRNVFPVVVPSVVDFTDNNYPDRIFTRKLLHPAFQSRDARNYVPIVPIVTPLSWKPNFPERTWRKRLITAEYPYKDSRDVDHFADAPIPFDAGAKLVAIVDTAEGWDTHFSSRGWLNIQDQLDAGYPLYCQPTLSAGYYEEVVDFGSEFSNSIITLSFNTELVYNNVACQPQLSYSTDGITFTPYENGTQLFAVAIRYVKFKLDFTSTDDLSVAYYSNVIIRLSVRRETDQGRVDCLASDVGGTLVNFTKAFKDVESITATPQTTSTYYTVIDFVDIPNPTSFRILVYDLSGTRVNSTVDWIARGIV